LTVAELETCFAGDSLAGEFSSFLFNLLLCLSFGATNALLEALDGLALSLTYLEGLLLDPLSLFGYLFSSPPLLEICS
jgi:hypothetical protein